MAWKRAERPRKRPALIVFIVEADNEQPSAFALKALGTCGTDEEIGLDRDGYADYTNLKVFVKKD